MSAALLLALAASFGIHLAALFGPDIDLTGEPELPPLVAELRPLQPAPEVSVRPKLIPVAGKAAAKSAHKKAAPRAVQTPPAPGVLATGDALPDLAMPGAGGEAPLAEARSPQEEAEIPAAASDSQPSPTASRLSAHGVIRFRIDRGDSNFEIGFARHEWWVEEGRYRLHSLAQTTGLAWLLKSVSVEMESVGQVVETGLRPDRFSVRRDGQETRERAVFDWENRLLTVGKKAPQPLEAGAQDLLSFNYQLGLMALPAAGSTLPVATGKKYALYRFEVVGDEDIQVPASGEMVLHTLHLRTPGEEGRSATELWLAYDFRMLPVKIRYVDNRGDSYVQVATEILLEQ
ncbi:DUF3108 domain-containing protein [Propionivibrio limicola]|uniref:DUF3108 domain-containing protein n=1 Tax=Propionivibrio limicola TaxID=167645 RepID=UPI0012908EF5|nr:DUF3108 domain-containing protein [Propionivibrio limicola]